MNTEKIKELKAEIFDLLVAQEQLQMQIAELEKVKAQKLIELKALTQTIGDAR